MSDGDRFLSSLEPVYLAETQKREAIYRLRYRVYVEEFGFKVGSADPGRKWLYDPEDDEPNCSHWYTASAGDVTGCVRVRNWAPGTVSEEIRRTYSLERFPETVGELGICELSRMAVLPDLRGKVHTVSLLCGTPSRGGLFRRIL